MRAAKSLVEKAELEVQVWEFSAHSANRQSGWNASENTVQEERLKTSTQEPGTAGRSF